MLLLPRLVRAAFAAALLVIISPSAPAEDTPDATFGLNSLKQSGGSMPIAIKQGAPAFPRAMSLAGISGTVKVEYIIDAEGKVRNAKAVESSRPEFEQSAVDAVMGWRYQPAELNGHPVKTRVTQVIIFDVKHIGKTSNRRPSP